MHNISKREKLTYTGSLLGQNMIYSFVTMYIMFFFTDLLRIPPESVTVILNYCACKYGIFKKEEA